MGSKEGDMINKRHAITIAIGLGLCFFLIMGTTESIFSEEQKGADSKEPAIFLSLSDLFKDVERPPVKFHHQLHLRLSHDNKIRIWHLF